MEEQRVNVVQEAHEIFDGLMKRAVGEAYRAGYIIPCARGCFSCCYEPAFVAGQEAELLVQAVSAMPAADQERVRASVKDWITRFMKAGLQTMKESNVFRYRAAKLACPLLKDGECTVYADRPIACRGHVAVGEREQCEDDEKRAEQRFLLSGNMCAIPFARIAEHEDIEFEHLGLWLHELFFGERVESASRTGLIVQDRPVRTE